jgi:putative transposase
LKGVSLDEWRETVRYMDRHLGTKKLHAQDAVRSCLKIVREVLALSKQRSGVLIHDSLEKKLDRFEKEFGFKQRYNQDQNFDYAAWDDGIDYEDQEDDDDEEFAAGRLSARLKARPPEERTIERYGRLGAKSRSRCAAL